MPKDLAALLVEEGAVPADVVERALARQREVGGTLDTALLELHAVPEETLAAYLARAAELPPAPAEAWLAGDARARRVFPSRVAERHGLAPFALDGRELALVATYPVDLGLLDEISFMLSLHLTAHVGPEWRVRELIHRIYGTPLPPRLASLAAEAGGTPAPPPAEAAAEPAPAAEPRPPPLTTAAAAAGFARDDEEPVEPLAAALAEALESVDVDLEEEPSAPAPASAPGPEGPEEEPDVDEAPVEISRAAPPHWTLDAARAAVEAARHRDEVVVAALRYARDFFEFAGMFAVTRDAVAGHDALGVEEARDRARTVAIWASDPGVFKTVIETQSPFLGPLAPGAAGTDAVLQGLGRSPRTALVYPILLRDRVVCILYADNGEAPVSARRLGDLLLFLSTVGGAFERIIRDRKRGRRRPAVAAAPASPPPAPPAAAAPEPPRILPVPAEEEGALSFAALEAEQASSAPPAPEAATARGRTAILWPDVAPPASAEAPAPPSDPPAAAAPPAPSPPPVEPAAPAPPPEPAPAPARPSRRSGRQKAQGSGRAGPRTPPPVATPPDPASLAALADRALDSDPAAASAACAALGNRRRDPGIRQAAEKLRRALLSGLSARSSRAARALGELRDVEAIPLLIQALETSDQEAAQAAADALAAITLQRHGPDARRWLTWWKENRGHGRAEWLFSGLTSPERETRVAASLELSHAAPPPVVYTADMPPPDREKAARAWAGWWARSGHVL